MSPALADIIALSEQLRILAGKQEWNSMLTVARDRQHQLEAYFSLTPPPDDEELIKTALSAVQQADQLLSVQARNHRQQLVQDAVDLRQRWQMSSTYQRVQNLQT